MMNVVIVGAGELGRHVAEILSKEKHSVILIDKNSKVLQEVSAHLDIATRHGSGTDWQLLDDLLEFSPDLFLALTGSDEVNLVACSIAKQMRYPRTIARVRDSRYTYRTRLDFGQIFDVDYFIGPELLAAHELLKHITSPSSVTIENFAHGALQLRVLQIPENWQAPAVPLKDFNLSENIIVGLIRRTVSTKGDKEKMQQVIFPHGQDILLPGDEVTLIGEREAIATAHELFGIQEKPVKSVVIAGGSLTGLHLAELLAHRDLDVSIIEKSFDKCALLAERVPHCTIMHHDATDPSFLRAEKVGQADMLVASTNSDEVNGLIGLLGQEVGCTEIQVLLKNTDYMSIATRLGFRYVVAPKIIATNHILSQLFSGKVTSLISLYENQAEVLEINVSLQSKVVGIPLSELGPYLPTDFLIVMIQNRGRIMIAHGDRVISPGDTIIVVTSPKHVDEIARIL